MKKPTSSIQKLYWIFGLAACFWGLGQWYQSCYPSPKKKQVTQAECTSKHEDIRYALGDELHVQQQKAKVVRLVLGGTYLIVFVENPHSQYPMMYKAFYGYKRCQSSGKGWVEKTRTAVAEIPYRNVDGRKQKPSITFRYQGKLHTYKLNQELVNYAGVKKPIKRIDVMGDAVHLLTEDDVRPHKKWVSLIKYRLGGVEQIDLRGVWRTDRKNGDYVLTDGPECAKLALLECPKLQKGQEKSNKTCKPAGMKLVCLLQELDIRDEKGKPRIAREFIYDTRCPFKNCDGRFQVRYLDRKAQWVKTHKTYYVDVEKTVLSGGPWQQTGSVLNNPTSTLWDMPKQ